MSLARAMSSTTGCSTWSVNCRYPLGEGLEKRARVLFRIGRSSCSGARRSSITTGTVEPSASRSSVAQRSRSRSSAAGSSASQASRTAVSSAIGKLAVNGRSRPLGVPSSTGYSRSRSDSVCTIRSCTPARSAPEPTRPVTVTSPPRSVTVRARARTRSTRRWTWFSFSQGTIRTSSSTHCTGGYSALSLQPPEIRPL